VIYGYARVSTDAQDLRNRVAQLKAGDVVVIPAADCLSRNATDLLVIARDM
jgi:DNA invertase Pin-like site-specific DNA recombinase